MKKEKVRVYLYAINLIEFYNLAIEDYSNSFGVTFTDWSIYYGTNYFRKLGKIYNKSVQLSSEIDLNVESSLFNKYRTL